MKRQRLILTLALGLALLGVMVFGLQSQYPGHSHAATGISYDNLLYKSGVYNLTAAADVPAASAAGIQLNVVADGGNTALTQAMASNNMQYLDKSIVGYLYRTYCPGGTPSSCIVPTDAAKQNMLAEIKTHVQAVKDTHMVAAYDLLDDYFTNMTDSLPAIYQTIRSIDPTTPTICGFSQNLAYTNSNGQFVNNTTSLPKELQNYSPSWCDSIFIYSYAPGQYSSTQPPEPNIEWDMHTTIPFIIQQLQSKGWNSTTQPLMGMPSAFGYLPRTGKAGQTFATPEWRFAPTGEQLSTQIQAFCNAGAKGIVPYVWNDNSPGTTYELYNSVTLRQGLQEGVHYCRTHNWPTNTAPNVSPRRTIPKTPVSRKGGSSSTVTNPLQKTAIAPRTIDAHSSQHRHGLQRWITVLITIIMSGFNVNGVNLLLAVSNSLFATI